MQERRFRQALIHALHMCSLAVWPGQSAYLVPQDAALPNGAQQEVVGQELQPSYANVLLQTSIKFLSLK